MTELEWMRQTIPAGQPLNAGYDRRTKIFVFPTHAILGVLRGMFVLSGWPEDATIYSAGWMSSEGCWYVHIGHESFDEVPLGERLPRIIADVHMVGPDPFVDPAS